MLPPETSFLSSRAPCLLVAGEEPQKWGRKQLNEGSRDCGKGSGGRRRASGGPACQNHQGLLMHLQGGKKLETGRVKGKEVGEKQEVENERTAERRLRGTNLLTTAIRSRAGRTARRSVSGIS